MTDSVNPAILLAIRECIAEIIEAPIAEIAEDADLEQELDVDSLQQLELAGMLEDQFGVFLDANDLSEVETIRNLAERATQKLGSPG